MRGGQKVAVHTFHPSTRDEAILVYRESSRIAKVTQRNHLEKEKEENHPQNKTNK